MDRPEGDALKQNSGPAAGPVGDDIVGRDGALGRRADIDAVAVRALYAIARDLQVVRGKTDDSVSRYARNCIVYT